MLEGIGLINAGAYFEAHEVLENEWKATKGEHRILYQGLIQFSVGCHHIRHANVKGALICFRNAESKLVRYSNMPLPFDLSDLLANLTHLQQKIRLNASLSKSVAEQLPLPTIRIF